MWQIKLSTNKKRRTLSRLATQPDKTYWKQGCEVDMAQDCDMSHNTVLSHTAPQFHLKLNPWLFFLNRAGRALNSCLTR